MEEPELYSALTTIFRDVLVNDTLVLSPDLTAKQVKGWDSFKQIEILLAVEQHYGVKFHTREVDRLENVGDLVSILRSKLSAAKKVP
jgi:acyl carrier protein